ncbi:MAG: TlpA family protein disulfide reductase, partial [Anaerolineae bacterium]|nr:TlpA family protein disulfide reductase [Anaerolineae bacterium]
MEENLDFLPQAEPKKKKEGRGLSTGSIVLIVGLVVFIAVLGLQLAQRQQVQPQPGMRAPDFVLTTFDGTETYRLSELRGQVVVVNFWADYCPPCHAEAPDLQDIYMTYKDRGVIMLGVNWIDIPETALGFINQYGISYPNGTDIGGAFHRDYNVEAPPETFVIDQEGIVRATILGNVP